MAVWHAWKRLHFGCLNGKTWLPPALYFSISLSLSVDIRFGEFIGLFVLCEQWNEQLCFGILDNLWGPRNRLGLGLPHRPAGLQRLAESIAWNRFLGSLKVLKYRLQHRKAKQNTLVWSLAKKISGVCVCLGGGGEGGGTVYSAVLMFIKIKN